MKIIILFLSFLGFSAFANDKKWVQISDKLAEDYSKELGKLYPENASAIGYVEFDSQAMNLTDDIESREAEIYKKWIQLINVKLKTETDSNVRIDLKILLKSAKNSLNGIIIGDKVRSVSYYDGSNWVFNQLQQLINPQSTQDRKNAAVTRFKLYVNGNPSQNHLPLIPAFKQYIQTKEKIYGKKKKHYSLKSEIALYLNDSKDYVKGIKELLEQTGRKDWTEDFKKFSEQIENYDLFIKEDILKKARLDYKLPKELYSFILEARGMSATPSYLIRTARRDYKKIYIEYSRVAEQIAIKHSLPKKDPVTVINFLKSKQITSAVEAANVYKEIDVMLAKIIEDNKIVTLPKSPLVIRIAGDAESKSAPVPHLNPPPLINNKGERPEFVVPSSSSGVLPFDDFSYKEAAYVLVAHEGRPGHDLQFSSMLDNGVSIIRSRYAFNNVNVEGWALYAEDLIYPHLPLEAKLPALQMRLWRIARMFLDPEVQTGKSDEQEVMKVFTRELGVSPVMAGLEFRRYTFKDPGQAPAYYYGLLKIRNVKNVVMKKMGTKFSEMCFNDAVLSLGLMPVDLIKEELVNKLKCD